MIRRLAGFLAGALVFCQVIPPASAAQFVVFKKTYIRQSGSPVTETSSFTILGSTGSSWTFRAINGDLEDASVEQVSSSTLVLNGTELLRPNQFSQNVSRIEESIGLQVSNTVSTQVRGKPGGMLTIEILGEDPAPPTVEWTAPQSRQILAVSTVSAALHLADDVSGLEPQSLLIRLDGTPTLPSGRLPRQRLLRRSPRP